MSPFASIKSVGEGQEFCERSPRRNSGRHGNELRYLLLNLRRNFKALASYKASSAIIRFSLCLSLLLRMRALVCHIARASARDGLERINFLYTRYIAVRCYRDDFQ